MADNNTQRQNGSKGQEKAVTIIEQWKTKSQEITKAETSTKFDFLNSPDERTLSFLGEVEAKICSDWETLPPQTRLWNVCKQFLFKNKGGQEQELSFMLRTRRIQYTLEHFRKLTMKPNFPQCCTATELADFDFVNEMRFQLTRLYAVSYIAGLNAGFLGYFGLFRHLRWYYGIPLTIIAATQVRNTVMRNSLDKVYLSIEPVFKEVKKNGLNVSTPLFSLGGKRDDKPDLDLFEQQLLKRDDVSDEDKEKFSSLVEGRKLAAIKEEAEQQLQQDLKENENDFQKYVSGVHDKFINEKDFISFSSVQPLASIQPSDLENEEEIQAAYLGGDAYKQYVEDYISYKYEPAVEAYDEARYFTYQFNRNLLSLQRGHKITEVKLKQRF